jgi:hypothetical protein
MTNTPTTPTGTPGSPRSSDGGPAERATTEARHVAESGREKVTQVAGEAQTQAADLARTAREQAKQRADGEVGRLAGFLDEIGDELDGMAAHSDESDGYLPGLARDGAQAANRLSRRLETGGLDGALHDIETFARRRPGMFLFAAFGVGLALGRVTRNTDMHAVAEEMNHDEPSGSHPEATQRPAQRAIPPATPMSPVPEATARSAGTTPSDAGRLP